MENILPSGSFSGVSGHRFYYPCAGQDLIEPLRLFTDHCAELVFEDIGYNFSNPPRLVLESARYEHVDQQLIGEKKSGISMRLDSSGRSYRHVDPGKLIDIFVDRKLNRTLRIIRQRGFGQYELDRVPDGDLGIFFHRGDSAGGESGSGAWFLANRRARHLKLANLFDKIKRCLSSTALIVSDGSNTEIPFLRKTYVSFNRLVIRNLHNANNTFEYSGLRWERIAQIGDSRHGPTFVWKVNRISH